jgi:hypothetical protein
MKSMSYSKRHNNEYDEKKIHMVKPEDYKKRPIKNLKKAWEEHVEDFEDIEDFFE